MDDTHPWVKTHLGYNPWVIQSIHGFADPFSALGYERPTQLENQALLGGYC